jgi:sugar/nucleoside kinase (ribokinase family)
MEQLDYLCIGHITRDLTPKGPSVGGTVAFSTRTAQALGKRVAVVTSCEPDYDLSAALPGIPVAIRPAAATSTFENIYTSAGRRQVLHSVAEPLDLCAIPPEWRAPRILHLGPLTNEVNPAVLASCSSEVIGLTPQGWHRCWDEQGHVHYADWPAAYETLPLATAVVVSWEDISDEAAWQVYRSRSRILVITNGAAGSEVHFAGDCRHFPPPKVHEVDPTGVGDIFAAAFFVRLLENGGDPWGAAYFATHIAAPTVERRGLEGIPTTEEVAWLRASLRSAPEPETQNACRDRSVQVRASES